MKTSPISFFTLVRAVFSKGKKIALLIAALATFIVLLPGHSAQAASYTYNLAASGGSWNAAANWNPIASGTYPFIAGDIANVTNDISVTNTINLNIGITVGTLNIGDLNTTNTFTIAAGTAGTLTFNNNGGGAQINEVSTSKGDTISAGIVIADAGGLVISNSSANLFTVSGGITGTGNLVLKSGSGAMTLSALSVNNTGTITNSGTGAGLTTVLVGANVTGVTESSTNSALTITTVNINSGGTTLTNNNASGAKVLTVSTSVVGTGNLILNNNSSVANGITITAGTINNTGAVSNTGSGTGGVSIAGLGALVTGVTENSIGELTLGASASFGGVVTLTSGTLNLNTTTSLGNGSLIIGNGTTLDDTVGNTMTTVNAETWNGNFTFLGTHTHTMGAGAITINGNVQMTDSGVGVLTFGGPVGGTGNLTINTTNVGAGTTNFTSLVNNNGTFTNTGSATATTTLSGTVGSNVTGITEASTTSALLLSGTLNVNSVATTLTNTLGTKALTVTNTIVGTGNLVINNNSATAQGITFTAGANNTGTITNSGTGGGLETIPTVGSNVTGLTESSTNSALTVTTLNINSGGTTLTNNNASGAALFTVATAVAGTGNLILNNNSSVVNGITLSASVNNTGSVSNTGTGSGGVSITGLGALVTGVTQNSSGPMTLGANASFTGPFTLTSGTLIFSSATSMGAGTLKIAAGTTLDASVATTISTTNAETWNGSFTFNGSFTLNTGAGAITLNASSITLTNAGASLLTLAGNATGTSALTLNDNAAGGITFTNLNNTGAVLNSGIGVGTTTLTTAGSNVTGLTESSATSPLSVGTLNINTSGTTTLTDASTSGTTLTVSTAVAGTGNLILNNNSPVLNGITLAAGVNNTGTVTSSGTGSGSVSLTGLGTNITGVTQNGAGAMTLGVNTFTTGVTLIAGTVNINVAGAAGTNGPLGNGGTFKINGGTINNTSGAAVAVLNVNPITIGTSFAYGTSTGGAVNNLTLPGAVSLATDQTITLNGADVLTLSGLLTNTSDSVRTLTVNNGAGTTAATLLSIGSFNLTGAGSTARIDIINGTANVTISGIIGNGTTALSGLTYAGSGTLLLGGANTLTGGLFLNSGNIVATVGGALGTAANILTFGGGNLELRDVATTYTAGINFNNTGETITINPASLLAGVTQIISGPVTLGTETTVLSPGILTNPNTPYGLTLSGTASFNAVGSNAAFTINGNGSGNGTLTLSGGFNTGGNTETLTLNSGTGSGVNAAVISGAFVGSSGTLAIAGNAPVTINALTATANVLRIDGSSTYTFAGASSFTGGVILNNASATYIGTAAGGFGSTSGKIKFNVGGITLDLRGVATSFTTGIDTSLFGGTITAEPASSGAGVTQTLTLANTLGSKTIVMSPGALTTSDSPYGLTLSGLNTFSTASTNATFTINGNGAGAGTLTLSGGFASGGNTNTLTLNSGTGSGVNSAVISGPLSGAGILALAGNAPVAVGSLTGATADAVRVDGSGTYTFNGASTFTGGLLLNNTSATVIATSAGGLGAGKVKFNVAGTTLDLRSPTAGTTQGTSFTSGIDSSSFGGTITVEPATSFAGTTHTLTLANTLGADTIVISPGALTTNNTPYGLTFTGLNTFSGTGVNSVFTINGNGSAGGALTLSGGFASGGNNNTLTLNSGAGTGVNSASISGALSGGGSLTLAGSAPVTVGALTSGTTDSVKINSTTGGVYTFNGANSFKGGLTLTAGVLNINIGNTGSTTTGALGDPSGTFTINGGTINNTSGAAVVVITVNPITIGGNFSYGTSAGTANNNLTLNNGFGGTFPGLISMAGDQTITLNGADVLTLSGTLTNTGNSARTLTVNNGAGTTAATTLSIGNFNLTGPTSSAPRNDIINGTGNVTISGVVADGQTAGSGLIYSGSGTGTLLLGGANTFTGGLFLNSGNIVATNGGAFGTAANTLTFGGGNLELRAAATTYAGAINLGGTNEIITINPAALGNGVTQTISGGATLGTETTTISAGSLTTANTPYGLTLSGAASFVAAGNNAAFTINGNGSGNGTLTLSGGFNTGGNTETLTFNSGTGSGVNSAVISGAFAGTSGTLALAGNAPVTINSLTTTANVLQINGSSTYTFAGTSSFTGGVILNNASATYIGTAAGGFGSTSGKVKFNVGGITLDLRVAATSFTTGIDTSLFGGTITVEPASSGAGVTQTLTLANTLGSNTIVMSPGALTTNNTPYGLTLSGLNTFSAANTNATFTINGNGSGAGTLTLSGGFASSGTTNTLTFNSGSGSGVNSAVISGPLSGAGILTLAGNAPVTIGALTGATADAVNVNSTTGGVYTFNSALGFFTGGVTLTAGMVNINSPGFGGSGPLGNGGTFTITGGTINNTSGGPIVEANVNPITIGGSFGYGTSAGTAINNLTLPGAVSLAADQTITLNGGDVLTLTGALTNTSDSVRTLTVNNGAGTTAATLLSIGSFNLTGAGSSAARNDIINGTGNVTISGVVSNGVTAGSGLTYNGSGILTLGGANTYTGPTSVLSGVVIATNAAALNSTTGGAVTVNGGTLDYVATANSALGLHTTLTITGGAGTVIGDTLGTSVTGAEISVTGIASATGAVSVNIFGVSTLTPVTGTYTLIAGGAGSSLNGATYSLGHVYGNTNFTIGALAATPTTVTVPITLATALTSAFWTGGLSGATNVWAASDGTANSNWVASSGGAAQALVPGAGADLTISNSAVTTAPTATVLGANMTIKTLTIADTTNGLGLNADGNTLTITPTIASTGITMNASVPASSIAAPVALGANQTWTNSSANPLTVSGIISGAFSLTTAGSGVVALSGINTFSNGLIVSSGTLIATGNVKALGASVAANALSLGAGTLVLTNASGVSLAFNTNTTVTASAQITSDVTATGVGNTYTLGTLAIGAQTLTVAGGNNVNGGTAGVTFGAVTSSSNTTFTVNNPANGGVTLLTIGTITPTGGTTLTFNGGGNTTVTGVIGATSAALVESGSGALTLGGANTFTGGVTLTSGTLNINNAGGAGSGALGNGGTFTINGGTIDNTNGGTISLVNAYPITIGGSFNFGGSNALTTAAAGAISLNSASITMTNSGAALLTLGGAATGTSNLTLNDNAAGGITLTSLNNTGTVVNSGVGAGTTTLTTVGTNVSGLTENSTTSPLTVTTLNVASGGTTLTNNNTSGSSLFKVNTAVAGTGNLVLNNNSAIAGGITIAAPVNDTGALTSSGTGAGTTVISGSIGTTVTSVTVGGTSPLVLSSGASTFTGGVTVNNGATLVLGNSAIDSGSNIVSGPVGTGLLTLNNGATLSNNTTAVLTNSAVFAPNITFAGSTLIAFDPNPGAGGANTVSPPTITTGSGANWTVNTTVYMQENIAFTPPTVGGTSLTVGGAGQTVLFGTNDFGGGSVVVNGGTLEVGFAGKNYGPGNGSSNTNPTNTNVTNWQINGSSILSYYGVGASTEFGTGTITLNNGATLSDLGTNGSDTHTNAIFVTGASGVLNITQLGNTNVSANATFGSLSISAPLLQYSVSNTFAAGSQNFTITGTTVLQNNVTINAYSLGDPSFLKLSGGVSDDGGGRSLTVTGTGGITGLVGVVIGGASTYGGSTFILNNGALYASAINALPDTAVTIDSTGSLHLDNNLTGHNLAFNQRILGLSGSGTVLLTAANGTLASTLTFDDTNVAHSYTFAGIITDSAVAGDTISLTKSGESTQILTGANSYKGVTSITGGVLQAQDGIGLPTLSLLTFSGSDGVLQSNGTFTRPLGTTGTSNQVNWAASSNGGFSAKGGTLTVALGGTASPTAVTWGTAPFVGGGQTLDFGSSTADSLVNFENNINLGATSTSGTVQVTGTAPAELSGVISGATSTVNLSLTGGGTLILAGANTYTGQTVIANGTLDVSSVVVTGGTSNLGNAATAITLGSTAGTGTLEYAGNSATMTRGFTLNNNGGITVDTAGQTLIVTGGVTLGSGHALTVSGSGNLTFSGSPITSSANSSGLVMNGLGTLTLAGSNTYTGPTTINSGIVSVGVLNSGTDSLGVGTDGGNVVTINGGTLQYIGAAASTTRNFTIGANGATLDASGSGPISFANSSGYIAFAAGNSTTLTLTGANTGANVFSLILSDPASGQLSLVKNGAGTWLLTGSNALAASQPNYQSGVTTINAGTLQVDYLDAAGNPQPLGTASSLILGGSNTAGTLQYIANSISPANNLNQSVTVGAGGGIINNTSGNTLTISGSLTKANTTLTLTGGAFNVTGQITGGNGSTFNSDFDVNGSSVTLSNASNNYTGPTLVYNGATLLDGVANALPVGTVLTTGSSSDSGSVTNTYDLNGNNQTIAALNSAGPGSSIVTNSGGSGTNTLTLSGTNSDGNTANGTFGGAIKDGANAKTALTVSGGTQTLSGSNSYTGATRVTGGTLIVTGSLSGSSALTIGNASSLGTSAILAGNGRVGNVTVGAASGNTGAEVEPSDGIAESAGSGTTLTTGSFTIGIGSGATLALQVGRTSPGTGLAGDGSDHISATGGVSLDGNLQLTVQTGYTASLNDVLYLILNSTATESGQFASVNGASLSGGNTFTFDNLTWHIDYNATATALTGGYDVAIDAFAPIPEPGTWAMMLSGMGMLIGLQRLRRRRN